jgi:hypothetical protein
MSKCSTDLTTQCEQAERRYVFKFTHVDGRGVDYGAKAINQYIACIKASELLQKEHGWMSNDLSKVKCIDYGLPKEKEG